MSDAPSLLARHLADQFDHDAWAQERLAQPLAAMPEGAAQDRARALFAHTTAAAGLWLARVQDTTPPPVWPTWTVEETLQRATVTRNAWQALLRASPEGELADPIRYVTTDGVAHTNTLAEIAAHVLLHGGHHRAQIALLLRQGGIEPPNLDAIVFTRHEASP